jgi:hypothetical protein
VFNQRGSSPFPFYRESVPRHRRDRTGTITITVFAWGGSRVCDTNGKLVLRDPGEVRFAFDVDFAGTPTDPGADVEITDSFRLVRFSTGRNDLAGRDFCPDLMEFTSQWARGGGWGRGY